jgi:chemotaxis protein MotB
MAGQSNAAPVIIKRKKVVSGGGHHGGAWKVAYADFVTAMMAFFLLMWLLNATTEKQRKGLSDYFNPTVAINRVSGGGEGALHGDSLQAEGDVAYSGSETEKLGNSETRSQAAKDNAAGDEAETAAIKAIETALLARSGESNTMEQLLRHVVTRVTDEGLIIEIFDIEGIPLFEGETASPSAVTVEIAKLLSEMLNLASNEIAVNGHVRAYPVTLRENPIWDLSAERAQAMRMMLADAGIAEARIQRVSGFADRKPATTDPAMIRNNRLEIILLRRNR